MSKHKLNKIDSSFTVADSTDDTKQFTFDPSNISGSTTRTLTVPDTDMTLLGTDNTAVVTNKTIDSASNTLTIAGDDIKSGTVGDSMISSSSVTQHEALIKHNNLDQYVANQHIDHSTVSVSAGTGLSGGGTLTETRTLGLDINGLTADGNPDGAADYVVTYDASDTSHKKVLLNNLPGGGTGGVNDIVISMPADTAVSKFIQTTSWQAYSQFFFKGSAALGTPTNIKVYASIQSNTGQVRVFDLTNSTIIATSGTISNTTTEVIDLGIISNVPTGESIWELQGTSNNKKMYVSTITIQF